MLKHQTIDFGEALEFFIKNLNISCSRLADLLSYKSKTTLTRIIGKQAGADSINKVYRDMVNCGNLHISNTEASLLKEAAEISCYGAEHYFAYKQLLSMLKTDVSDYSRYMLTDLQQDPAKTIPLSDFFDAISDNRNEIIILNTLSRPFIDPLCKLLNQSEKTNITHFIGTNEKLIFTVDAVRAVLPLIYNSRYTCYTLNTENRAPECFILFNSHTVLIRSYDKNNVKQEFQLQITSASNGIIYRADGIFDHYETLLKQYLSLTESLKTSYPSAVTAEGYIGFTRNYADMEKCNVIYTFRPDPCLNYIPIKIAYSAFIDGIRASGITLSGSNRFIRELASIQENRFNNIFHGKTITHGVLSQCALKKFINTGVQTDHFFAMRPYTVSERTEILNNLLDNVMNNPFFNIYLLKNDDEFIETETTSYDNKGVQFTSSYTDYDLSNGHCEALITHREFLNLFNDFFMNELVKNYCLPIKDTVIFIKALLKEATI